MCATSAKIIKETATNYNFSKWYTSVENGPILPIIKLDLDTIMTKLNTNFHIDTCNKWTETVGGPTDRQTAAKQQKKTMKNSQIKFKTNSYVFNKLYPNKIDALTWFLITTIICT